MQGTLENAILAGADMMKGDGMQDALLQQNWEKTQYRAADWLSDWAAQKGRRDAEDWKSSQQKEGILGLAWLGLSRAGSMLSSAWDGVSELFNATVRNTKTQNNEALTHNTNDYEVIMTDAGYARKYADGRYEYIDEVTARAEMYKQTYGGEVVETKANGNKGLNPDKMRDMRELQDDGSYKVTIYDDNGNVVQQYYEVKKLDTSKALGYEDAMRLSGGDKQYDAVDMVRNIFINEAKILSTIYSDDLSKQFLAVKDYLYNNGVDIYRAYNEIGIYDEEVVGNVIATVAQVLAETTTIKYGEMPGNFNYYDSGMENSNKSTYFMGNWNWENPQDPLAAYTGNNGQPKLDCAGFVGLVLDIAGITNGTEGRDYNALKGLNLLGKYNGVRNIVDSGLFKEIQPGKVKVGDLAVYNTHILIVSKVNKGYAEKYIHSSIYDYNINKKNRIGVQQSPFTFSEGNIYYIRYKIK